MGSKTTWHRWSEGAVLRAEAQVAYGKAPFKQVDRDTAIRVDGTPPLKVHIAGGA